MMKLGIPFAKALVTFVEKLANVECVCGPDWAGAAWDCDCFKKAQDEARALIQKFNGRQFSDQDDDRPIMDGNKLVQVLDEPPER